MTTHSAGEDEESPEKDFTGDEEFRRPTLAATGNLWWRRLHEMEGCGAQANAEKEALRARTRSI
jgi:hypothetical protein